MDQVHNISKSSASTTYPPATAGGTDPIQARCLTFEAKPTSAPLTFDFGKYYDAHNVIYSGDEKRDVAKDDDERK